MEFDHGVMCILSELIFIPKLGFEIAGFQSEEGHRESHSVLANNAA